MSTSKDQRRYALATSGGVCEVCGRPLNEGQPQGAHRIGNTKANRAKYGDFIIDHRLNMGMTCSLKCIYETELQIYGGENERVICFSR